MAAVAPATGDDHACAFGEFEAMLKTRRWPSAGKTAQRPLDLRALRRHAATWTSIGFAGIADEADTYRTRT